MNTHNDGGPAFPTGLMNSETKKFDTGMSLRDWFAGQALAVLAPKQVLSIEGRENKPLIELEYHLAQMVAKASYTIADALLLARKGVVQQSDETPKDLP